MDPAKSTIFKVIAGHAARQPDRPALLSPGLAPLSFADLFAQIGSVWKALSDVGLTHHSRVGLALPSGPESALITVAIASSATAVPLNPSLGSDEFEHDLARFDLDALVLPAWTKFTARDVGERACLPLIEVSKASTSLNALRLAFVGSASTGAKALSFRQPPGVALLLRTSGTTGIPKLVPVTHGNLLEMAIKMERWLGLSSDDRTACLLPTYYARVQNRHPDSDIAWRIDCSASDPMDPGLHRRRLRLASDLALGWPHTPAKPAVGSRRACASEALL